ncbi:MAG: flippase-like domain-containing protein, partial [Caldilineaceae bacterium]|nr:flippase-like domain-containing protein [Caldilineaceae bacterium]
AASTMLVRQPQQLLRTISIAMSTHVADLLTLTLLFRAFNQPTTLSIIIIIYAMTVLFRIISPTPNGIGVVETLLPAIYVSVNVPLEVGTVINLTFRGISFWIPLVIGMICLHYLQASADTALVVPAEDSPGPLV